MVMPHESRAPCLSMPTCGICSISVFTANPDQRGYRLVLTRPPLSATNLIFAGSALQQFSGEVRRLDFDVELAIFGREEVDFLGEFLDIHRDDHLDFRPGIAVLDGRRVVEDGSHLGEPQAEHVALRHELRERNSFDLGVDVGEVDFIDDVLQLPEAGIQLRKKFFGILVGLVALLNLDVVVDAFADLVYAFLQVFPYA